MVVLLEHSLLIPSHIITVHNKNDMNKYAHSSLTRGLACEYACDGIRVNSIAPGVVPVERTEQAFSDPNVVDMWTPHLPVGRLGTVEDIAEAALMLATNEWMTGSVLTVDGGMMARANMPNDHDLPSQ